MYDPTGASFARLAFAWPAIAAQSASELSAALAGQFARLSIGFDADPPAREPEWTTPNTVALDLKTVRLRDFSLDARERPALVCAPYALHGSTTVDLAPGHSVIETLRSEGVLRLFVADWRSADESMRDLDIDNYLADLNVLVDDLGGRIDLIGICQGGWLALVYAARFPAKIRKLVIAGAPIDTAAAPSSLSALAAGTPSAVFKALIQAGDGRVRGTRLREFWCRERITPELIRRILQTREPIGSPEFTRLEARFRAWDDWVLDLPGAYYLSVVERLYKRNELASGRFAALGRTIDLGRIAAPVFLLAARDDEIVAPAQLFAAAALIGTPAHLVVAEMAPCGHLGLFAGRAALRRYWTKVARWLSAETVAPI